MHAVRSAPHDPRRSVPHDPHRTIQYGNIPHNPRRVIPHGLATQAVKEQYGFLRCETREGLLFFHFAQLHLNEDTGRRPEVHQGDEFEFVVGVDEQTGKTCALSLRHLRQGARSTCRGATDGQR